ncbi:glycoside hydrolase family 57 protein [Coprobacter tertius]|uniref:Glycoside hydrolase family 57 protein n=1 Tax=Coprobacter tertius TaxID=2944915 RepID=A0ABT1MGM1_9BACT|nr:glycoside hydrolase family 57 protein [Coprobacter tertius]MCP9611521.1 glycoside hydrolase family 57 protein [Coprobacter tertius]
MKTICFYFQIHQPFRLKRYRFFDIGNDHYYYDDFNNEEIMHRIAQRSYIPANYTLLEMIKNSNGKFKAAFSISGIALEQLEIYVPEFIDSMKELIKTGCVEMLSETYAHSLASLKDPEEFANQIKAHDDKIETLFGVRPKVFRNTELIYSDDIASMVSALGFKGCITEGAKHILGWKSPNYLYNSTVVPKLKLLLKNSKVSDDITFRFSNYDWSEYPLTADKFMRWIHDTPEEEQIINLFMNYETLGELQPRESGIFEFMRALPRFAEGMGITFSTPSEVISKLKPVGSLSMPYPISWADEERDTSAWLGNVLQNEAFEKLYSVAERVRLCDDRRLKQDWNYLQTSDHFYYMCTKHFSDGAVHSHYSPYETPYEAFTNYMNVLSDFIVRVEAQYPASIENEELNSLITTIRNQASEIELLQKELKSAKAEKKAAALAKKTAQAKIPTKPKTDNTDKKVQEKKTSSSSKKTKK